jgi:hypothetical protein
MNDKEGKKALLFFFVVLVFQLRRQGLYHLSQKVLPLSKRTLIPIQKE